MSQILAINDLATNEWDIRKENLKHNYVDIRIGFKSSTRDDKFNNLRFSFALKQGNNTVVSHSFPSKGVRYIQSNDEYLITKRLSLQHNTDYEIIFCCNENNKPSQSSIFLKTPLPRRPYPSWIFNHSKVQWEPPVERPNTSKDYAWDEKTQSWIQENGDADV